MTEILRNTPEPVSVSEISNKLKRTLEQSFDYVRVRGELSGLKMYPSGLYVNLKDENAVLNAVCWKGNLSKLAVKPAEGLEVICTGKITAYVARSNYQLTIESMELAGQGALLKMLEDQRLRLEKEGLFAASRKKPLPFIPTRIGIITSPSGAVIQDMLHRLRDRFPCHVLLWPATVQGPNTVRDVVAGLKAFDTLPADLRPDVIIVARGGGSFEDLVQFSNEDILRAVAACTIPVISAIGHETDTTQIDFVSDWRAPTPTAAAERVVPVLSDLISTLGVHDQRLRNLIFNRLKHNQSDVRLLQTRLGDPVQIINAQYQKLDFVCLQARQGLENLHARRRQDFAKIHGSLRHPDVQIKHAVEKTAALGQRLDLAIARQTAQQEKLKTFVERLDAAITRHVDHMDKMNKLTERLAPLANRKWDQLKKTLSASSRMLDSFSYKKTLERGFALVETEDRRVVTSADMARQHKTLKITFADDQSIRVVPDTL